MRIKLVNIHQVLETVVGRQRVLTVISANDDRQGIPEKGQLVRTGDMPGDMYRVSLCSLFYLTLRYPQRAPSP